MEVVAVALGLCLAIPLILLSAHVLAPRSATRDDLRARRLRRAIRRWRLQRAAKPELAQLGARWEQGQ